MKTIISISAFFAFLFLLSLNYAIAQDLNEAIYKTKAQQYDEAIEILNGLINKSPNNGELYFYKGEVYIKSFLADTFSLSLKETSDLAIPVFNEGAKMDPNNSFSYIGLGHLAILYKEYSKADDYFAKAKALLPEYNLKKVKKIKNPDYISTVLVKIAEAQILTGAADTAKILPLLREAEIINPGNAEIYLVAGDAYLTINDGNNAVANYNKAQILQPNSPAANIKKGNIYIRVQNYQAALPYFELALKIDSTYAPVYRELGKLYSQSGRFEEAKRYYAKYLELSGNNIPAKIRYISSLYYSKDYDEAIRQIEEVLTIDTTYSYLYRLAAYCYFDKKDPDYEKARFYINKLFHVVKEENRITKDYVYHGHIILNIHKDFVKLNYDNSRSNAEISKYIDLLKNGKSLEEKNKIQSKIDSINKMIMQKYSRIEDSLEIENGFEYLIIAFNKEYTNTSMANHIATLYNSFKQYNNAAIWYQKKIELSTQPNINDFMSLGYAFYNCNKFDPAIVAFTKVTEMDSQYVPGFYMLANTYSAKDPDFKEGIAKLKYELLIEKAIVDTAKNCRELNVAYSYLGSYYLFVQKDFDLASTFYDKLIWLEPNNVESLLRAFTSLAYLYSLKKDYTKVRYYYAEILKIDPQNIDAKKNLEYYRKLK